MSVLATNMIMSPVYLNGGAATLIPMYTTAKPAECDSAGYRRLHFLSPLAKKGPL
jgi:hypothetical protein